MCRSLQNVTSGNWAKAIDGVLAAADPHSFIGASYGMARSSLRARARLCVCFADCDEQLFKFWNAELEQCEDTTPAVLFERGYVLDRPFRYRVAVMVAIECVAAQLNRADYGFDIPPMIGAVFVKPEAEAVQYWHCSHCTLDPIVRAYDRVANVAADDVADFLDSFAVLLFASMLEVAANFARHCVEGVVCDRVVFVTGN